MLRSLMPAGEDARIEVLVGEPGAFAKGAQAVGTIWSTEVARNTL